MSIPDGLDVLLICVSFSLIIQNVSQMLFTVSQIIFKLWDAGMLSVLIHDVTLSSF